MKKLLYPVAVAMLVLSCALVGCAGGGSSEQEPESMYADGQFTGEGTGKSGLVQVTLTIADDQITAIDIVDPGETAGIGGAEAIANGTFADQVLTAQGPEIEGVVGATLTSNGVREAVRSALEQAAAAVSGESEAAEPAEAA